MQIEISLVDESVMWGVLEYTSNFETIEAISRLVDNSDTLCRVIIALASNGYTLSFDGPRDDVSILDSKLLSQIVQLCNRAEVHSGDFKYVRFTKLLSINHKLGIPNHQSFDRITGQTIRDRLLQQSQC
jgi:hypothetical protein